MDSNHDPPDFTSGLAGIMDVNHCAQLNFFDIESHFVSQAVLELVL
jgi:uncharacterized MAPEG superfamily protein